LPERRAKTLKDFLGSAEGRAGEAPEAALALSRLEEALESLASAVEELERAVRELAERLGEALRLLPEERGEEAEAPEEGGGHPPAPGAAEAVVKEALAAGFVSLKALEALKPSERLKAISALKREGFVEVSVGGDVLLVEPAVYKAFVEGISSAAKSSDPQEAAEALGPAGRLFNELHRRGALYFDAKSSRWKLLG